MDVYNFLSKIQYLYLIAKINLVCITLSFKEKIEIIYLIISKPGSDVCVCVFDDDRLSVQGM